MKKLISIGVLGGMICGLGVGMDCLAQTGSTGKKKKPARKKAAPPQTDPSTLPVGVQEMLRTAQRTGPNGEIQAPAGTQPTYNGVEQSPKPTKKRPVDNSDFGAPPREVVRGEQVKKAAENENEKKGETPPPAATDGPIEELKRKLADLQAALQNSENSDSAAEKEKVNGLRVQISDLLDQIRKLESQGKKQGGEVPKRR